jgi:hypothetical protein
MPANQRVAGLIRLQTNGEILMAKGDFTYNLGRPKREAIIGRDGVHGFKETPQVAFIEGTITDAGDIDVAALDVLQAATVNLKLGNGKQVVLGGAYFAGDGTGSTNESEITVRWEGTTAEEIAP